MAEPDAYLGLGLPDPSKRLRNPAAERSRAYFREVARRDPPSHHADNPWLQAQSFVDVVYLGVNAVMAGLAAATVRVTQRRPRAKAYPVSWKSLPSAGRGEDHEYVPADPDHPLCQLFNDELRGPNPVDTVGGMLAQAVMHLELYGESVGWVTPTDSWDEAELYYVPRPILQPLVPSPEYPCGGYRAMNWYPGLAGSLLAGGSVEMDNRDLIRHRYPHPLWRHTGYSPLTAGAKSIDTLRAINTIWKKTVDHAPSIRALVGVDGITPDGADDLKARLEAKFAGAEGDKFAVFDGEKMTVEPFEISSLKELEMSQGYDRMVAFVAALYKSSPGILGLEKTDSYAALYARLKAHAVMCLKPRADLLAGDYTKHLARRHWPDERLRIEIDLPKIDDPEEMRSWAGLKLGDVYTVNEARALQNLPPVEDGDRFAWEMQAAQQQPPGTPGQPPDGGQGQPGEPGQGHPLDAVGDAVLEALGVGPVAKAYGGGQWDESKHARDGGKFAAKPGASAGGPSVPPDHGPVPPDVQRHPKVLAALGALAKKAKAVAANVNGAMLAANLTPEMLVGDQTKWETWFVSMHADVVAHHIGVDAVTAAHVLTHLAAKAVGLVKKHLTAAGPGGPAPPPGPAPSPNGTGTGKPSANGTGKHAGSGPTANLPPRPANPQGAGSLPKRGSRKSLRKLIKGLK